MSSEAARFVTKQCAHVKAPLRYTLLVMATYADPDGRGIRASAKTIADGSGKSKRQTEKDIAALRVLGELAEGDQGLVAHLPPEQRPVVFDLTRMATLASVTPLSGRKAQKSEGPCKRHAGQKAATCGPCRSERIATG